MTIMTEVREKKAVPLGPSARNEGSDRTGSTINNKCLVDLDRKYCASPRDGPRCKRAPFKIARKCLGLNSTSRAALILRRLVGDSDPKIKPIQRAQASPRLHRFGTPCL